MEDNMKQVLAFSIILLMVVTIMAAEKGSKHAITFGDFINMKRLGDTQLSPDGKTIAFVVTVMNKLENTRNSDIWLMSVNGSNLRQLTSSPKSDGNPRWSPDGKKIAFISGRSGSPQIWIIPIDGGEAKKLTDMATGVSGFTWSPDGKAIAFASEVYPDCADDACTKKREDEKENSKVGAKVFDSIFIRHFDSWRDEKRSHLFIIPLEGGTPKDLTPGNNDVPTIALGSDQDFVFSPDGKELCFVMNTDPLLPVSTNNDLFIVPTAGGEAKRITTSKADDNGPMYSPDGLYIAYRAMARPGFEADKQSIMLFNRKTQELSNLTEKLDRSAEQMVWTPDGKSIYFTVQESSRYAIYKVNITKKSYEKILDKMTIGNFEITPDEKTIIFEKQASNLPWEIFSFDIKTKAVKQLTETNKELLSGLEMNTLEEFWFTGGGGEKIHGMLLKPPFFDPNKKYPLVMLIHGGPQGAWEDEFHYRWNYQMFASAGYVLVMINFHGSTGYGQGFTDSISGDWGGKPYEDIMKGLDYALANYKFIDSDRMCAAGASYGGYMINWLEGHTDRFKCLISHAGLFDLRGEWGGTEELWFPEWDLKGTPWTSELYQKFSPSYYVPNFKTPCLVIHGQQDFRIPVEQAIQMFTSLQRVGVPSRFIYFPDETHFVVKPQNAEFWWKNVHEWLAKYLK
jgi:dipeptidyl aminopeptidase/acylaminoacyl peptidase